MTVADASLNSLDSIEAQLIAQYGWLVQLARRLLRDPSAADDVVQDTMIVALRRPPATDRPLRPWLATVLRRGAGRWRRSSERRVRREDSTTAAPGAPQGAESPADLAEAAETARTLLEEVERLPEPQRATILEHFLRHRPLAEIARARALPEATVRSHLHRGLTELRHRIDAREGGAKHGGARLLALAGVAPAAKLGAAALGLAVAGGIVVVTLAGVGLFGKAFDGKPASESPGARDVAARATPALENPVADAPTAPDVRRADANGIGTRALPALTVGLDEAVIRIRVVDPAMSPIPGATVRWTDGFDTFTTAGRDGFALLRFQPPAGLARVLLEVSADGAATTRAIVAAPIGVVTDATDVVLPRALRVTGRVTLADGTPVANAFVAVTRANAIEPGPIERRVGPEDWTEFVIAPQFTENDGTFAIDDVPAVPIRVWAASESSMFVSIAIAPDAHPRVALEQPLLLEPLDDVLAITGVVVEAHGAPLARALVTLEPSESADVTVHRSGPAWRRDRLEMLTDATGKYRLTPRGAGPFRLRATRSDAEADDAGAVLEPIFLGSKELRLAIE